MSTPSRPFVSKGQVLQSPPLSFRISRFFHDVYFFLGLYIVTLFSIVPSVAAENSQFNVTRPKYPHNTRRLWGGSSYYGGGGGGGPGGSGDAGPKRFGRVDDIRGPECSSCR
ncbi:hypothetical protein Egran_02375 [Elaphomyces granulatus]|uniref:Uncharacterized protein n=1 Tax=Elaphomyces granulatus TaxID=519963 RepID=A0A232M0H5_9EURO|nr:hypothetical protein Egran_02375 [Elaphomyces granulatus]